MNKTCAKCGTEKNQDEFYKSRRAKSGLQTYCKACCLYMQRSSLLANPGARRKISKLSREKHRDRATWKSISNRLDKKAIANGICSLSDFRKWWSSTPHICIYCGITDKEALNMFNHHLHVDRKDPHSGYTHDNMCRACMRCNLVKNKYLSFDQMQQVAAKFFKAKGE